jgi:hypothetical protein
MRGLISERGVAKLAAVPKQPDKQHHIIWRTDFIYGGAIWKE